MAVACAQIRADFERSRRNEANVGIYSSSCFDWSSGSRQQIAIIFNARRFSIAPSQGKEPPFSERIQFTANDASTLKRMPVTALQSKERTVSRDLQPDLPLFPPFRAQHIEIHSIPESFKYFTLLSWYRRLLNHLLMVFHFCVTREEVWFIM